MARIAYLAPVFSPAVGGGVAYVSILARELPTRGACARFTIITERHPGAPVKEASADGSLEILRIFPFRAGRSTRGFASYLAYALQNAQFLRLLRVLPAKGVLFVHGSFFNNPTLLSVALRSIRKARPGLRLVLDLRDPKFPGSVVKKAASFDATISCSKNISERLSGVSNVWEIPVMIEGRFFTQAEQKAALEKYGLHGKLFIFNGSGFNKGKGSDVLIRLAREIRASGRDVGLVVAGKRRFWNADLQDAHQEGWLMPLGIIPSIDVRLLASLAWLDANLSTVDSFPRHSLEALASGARVLLPQGVPEFADVCPEHVVTQEEGGALAARAIAIAEGAIGACRYPWEKHLPDVVIAQYMALIDSLI